MSYLIMFIVFLGISLFAFLFLPNKIIKDKSEGETKDITKKQEKLIMTLFWILFIVLVVLYVILFFNLSTFIQKIIVSDMARLMINSYFDLASIGIFFMSIYCGALSVALLFSKYNMLKIENKVMKSNISVKNERISYKFMTVIFFVASIFYILSTHYFIYYDSNKIVKSQYFSLAIEEVKYEEIKEITTRTYRDKTMEFVIIFGNDKQIELDINNAKFLEYYNKQLYCDSTVAQEFMVLEHGMHCLIKE